MRFNPGQPGQGKVAAEISPCCQETPKGPAGIPFRELKAGIPFRELKAGRINRTWMDHLTKALEGMGPSMPINPW